MESDKNPIIFVEQGQLRGKISTDAKGGTYYSFQGIPYAEPPLDHLRFKAPKPPQKWEGIRNATKEANRSISRSLNKKVIGSEDCLYLNIYTKKLPVNDTEHPNLHVLFWIHGGGFITGSGNSDLFAPDFLLVEDIIVVTINYRLGLLGFLSFEDPSLEIPGNAGLKDMVAAFNWVRKNIKVFGGDPNRITVAGESAGGAAAQLLATCSPLVPHGSVYTCIAQSGAAFSPWARCVRRAVKFAQALCPNPDIVQNERDAYNILKCATTQQLIDALDAVANLNDKLSFRVIGPIVEKPCTSEEAFLVKDPEQIYADGEAADIPLIIGFNDADGMIYASQSFRDRTIPIDFIDVEDIVPHHELGVIRGTPLSQEIGKRIKEYYYGNDTPSKLMIANYIKLQTDLKFTLITKKVVEAVQKVCKFPVYLYRFTVDTPNNLYKKFLGLKLPGAAHGDELTFLFKTSYPMKFLPDSIEEKSVHRMVKLWTQFMKTGNPNSQYNDELIDTMWFPVCRGEFNHLEIGATLKSFDEEPEFVRMEFWNKIFEFVAESN